MNAVERAVPVLLALSRPAPDPDLLADVSAHAARMCAGGVPATVAIHTALARLARDDDTARRALAFAARAIRLRARRLNRHAAAGRRAVRECWRSYADGRSVAWSTSAGLSALED